MGDVLKANVLNFAGMGEEQVLALPPEARMMVMTGTNALMNAQAQGGGPADGGGGGVGPNGPNGMPGMMAMNGMAGMGQMNPMAMGGPDMGAMPQQMPMGMGMGVNVNGEMGMGMPPGGMMQDGGMGATGTPEMTGHMALPEGMMGMGMGMNPDFASAMQQVSPLSFHLTSCLYSLLI